MSGRSLVQLGTCLSRASTWNPLRVSADDVFRYIDLSSVDQDTKAISDAREVACGEAPSRARQLVAAGDVLVSTVRPNLNGVARVPSELDGATASTGFCVLRPEPKKLDGSYLFQWVKSSAFISDMVSKATGASYPAVSDRIIFESAIPLPPLEEQLRIAAILDQAETLRTQRRQALAHLDTLTQSLFLDMFGDPVANPKYQTGTIRQFVEANSGKSAKAVLSESLTDVPIYGGNGINGWATTPLYDQPVLVFGRVGQQCGNAFLTEGPSWVTDNAIVVRIADASRLIAKYVLHAFQGSDFSSRVKHLDLPFINQGMILDNPIPLPPLTLQQTFATRIQAIDALKATHRTALAQLNALFASLQQRAFAGELTAQAPTTPVKRRFAELGQLNALKGVESLVYAAKRLPGKGHYWPTKVQYFADKRHLERYGCTLYGETHVSMPYGPVPQAAFNASRALANGELISEFPMDAVRAALRRDGDQLTALRDADTTLLGAKERKSLEWAIRYVKDMNFEQLKTASHDAAWQKTAPNAPMAWLDIIATLEPEVQKRLLATFE
ncbi:MAG: restriction endonuclease subunit S [Rhodoferax sp.]